MNYLLFFVFLYFILSKFIENIVINMFYVKNDNFRKVF